jgi:hypothetical protein
MKRLACVCALVSTVVGCAGARTEVVAPTANVPVSFSRSVRDQSGEIVGEERRQVVGHFESRHNAWGMFYSIAKLDPFTDISNEINEQVAAAHGDAVIHLSIRSKPCATDFVPVFNWLPFWPGCTKVVVEGDIIRVRREEAKR